MGDCAMQHECDLAKTIARSHELYGAVEPFLENRVLPFRVAGARVFVENEMTSDRDGDFARLLDDLFQAAAPEADKDEADSSDSDASSVASTSAPKIPFDYLSVVDELHSGRISVSAQEAAAEYGVNAQIDEILREFDARRAEIVPPPIELEQWPSIEPAEIAEELDLGKWRRPEDLARIRRSFAFDNHPDRVAAHLRDHAITRMQIANMLIDEAQRRYKR